jgi:hypothetical protein
MKEIHADMMVILQGRFLALTKGNSLFIFESYYPCVFRSAWEKHERFPSVQLLSWGRLKMRTFCVRVFINYSAS